MKKCFFLAAFLFSSISGWSQWDTLKSQPPVYNIVKISPFHFVEGTFLLAYERMMGPEKNSSLMFQAGLHSRETFDQPEPSFGTLEELQWRYYVAPPQNEGVNGSNFMYFKGFFAGPFLYHRYRAQTRNQWDWISQTNVEVKENINEVAGGVLLGVQVALGNRFYMDFYTGGGVKHSFGAIDDPSSSDDNRTVVDVGYNGVIPKIGFLIGIGI